MVDAYRTWIGERAQEADALTGTLRETGQLHVAEANKAADRMAAGVAILQHDARTMQAFRLSNEAMYLQRNRQDWIRAGAGGVPTFDEQSWRPFQIAFVLINLPALADRSHPDRELADLLWFPTGGGKTEAYLGLIAFTIFHRRLTDRNASGVAVIMRYTLRLLTIQQFERAAMLLCSLETIRRRDTATLGGRSFSIGLWVGRASTPNTLKEATTALNALRRGDTLEEGNPAQLTRCPWCNQYLEPGRHYRVAKTPMPRLVIACGNRTCDFAQGLPVHVVDEDIYEARPELVIGTVDKFARMAWDDKVGGLFAADGSGSKPDLIIQDELHLIAGPLGSVVGLYETAVDLACEDRSSEPPTRAKVIASTATIRRAEAQVRAIFDRGVAQFPPPGLEPDNSFFAAVAERDVLGTRLYLGAMAPGTSHTTLMIRIYAALLHNAQALPGSGTVRDTYWTLMGYFNSLRVLGSAFLQVSDDVGTRLELLSRRDGVPVRKVGEPSELTSRVPSSEIPARLKSLEAALGNTEDDEVQNVVLATNMISVGLDVDRLGLMAVMGQPQSSAEYIQATSRVGRKFPALVVAIYNSARSRDRSHYESFLPFHEALYRAVESVSATPYAARARDRALHGALVSAVRLTIYRMSSTGGAARIEDELDAIHDLTDRIVERIVRADSSESQAAATQLEGFVNEWSDAAADTPDLKYSVWKQRDGVLIRDASDAIGEGTVFGGAPVPWPTLQSMRDVDAESTVLPTSERKSLMSKLPTVRRAQLLSTYGIGGLFPSGNTSFMIMGLDDWATAPRDELNEPRLARSLGIRRLFLPPSGRPKGDVPARRFPQTQFCPGCHRVGDVFKDFRCGHNEVQCKLCSDERELIPFRLMVACTRGHVDEFPLFEWLHKGTDRSSAAHRMSVNVSGTTSSLADMRISCSCGAPSIGLDGAFSPTTMQELGVRCRGRRPWLHTDDSECTEKPRTVQRGASNVWFAAVQSAIAIPPYSLAIAKFVDGFAPDLADAYGRPWQEILDDDYRSDRSPEGCRFLFKRADKSTRPFTRAGIEGELERRKTVNDGADVSEQALRRDEYKALIDGSEDDAGSDFVSLVRDVPDGFRALVARSAK